MGFPSEERVPYLVELGNYEPLRNISSNFKSVAVTHEKDVFQKLKQATNGKLSTPCIMLLAKMLHYDPAKRPSIVNICNDELFTEQLHLYSEEAVPESPHVHPPMSPDSSGSKLNPVVTLDKEDEESGILNPRYTHSPEVSLNELPKFLQNNDEQALLTESLELVSILNGGDLYPLTSIESAHDLSKGFMPDKIAAQPHSPPHSPSEDSKSHQKGSKRKRKKASINKKVSQGTQYSSQEDLNFLFSSPRIHSPIHSFSSKSKQPHRHERTRGYFPDSSDYSRNRHKRYSHHHRYSQHESQLSTPSPHHSRHHKSNYSDKKHRKSRRHRHSDPRHAHRRKHRSGHPPNGSRSASHKPRHSKLHGYDESILSKTFSPKSTPSLNNLRSEPSNGTPPANQIQKISSSTENPEPEAKDSLANTQETSPYKKSTKSEDELLISYPSNARNKSVTDKVATVVQLMDNLTKVLSTSTSVSAQEPELPPPNKQILRAKQFANKKDLGYPIDHYHSPFIHTNKSPTAFTSPISNKTALLFTIIETKNIPLTVFNPMKYSYSAFATWGK